MVYLQMRMSEYRILEKTLLFLIYETENIGISRVYRKFEDMDLNVQRIKLC